MSKRGLGKGLGALLATSSQAQQKQTQLEQSEAFTSDAQLVEIPLNQLQAGQYQPREHMKDDGLNELAASIRSQGVIQPIIIRQLDTNRYEIIAGERRYRAAKIAGLKKVPCVIKSIEDKSAIAMALIENIQREDLNPIEESNSLLRLKNEFNLTHQEIADVVGKSRSSISNILRLNSLTPDVKQALAEQLIDMGHARALLTLEPQKQSEIAKIVIAKKLTVRQTESLIKQALEPEKTNKKQKDNKEINLVKQFEHLLGTTVSIRRTAKGKGKLTIDFDDLAQLEAMLNTKLIRN
ncbi:MAG: ParB/RepB/Spo0J family partition protein [Vibrio sp.]